MLFRTLALSPAADDVYTVQSTEMAEPQCLEGRRLIAPPSACQRAESLAAKPAGEWLLRQVDGGAISWRPLDALGLRVRTGYTYMLIERLIAHAGRDVYTSFGCLGGASVPRGPPAHLRLMELPKDRIPRRRSAAERLLRQV
jgi:hypothetical protein